MTDINVGVDIVPTYQVAVTMLGVPGSRGGKGPPGSSEGPISTVNGVPADEAGNAQVTVKLSQAAYNLIAEPDPRIIYFITD